MAAPRKTIFTVPCEVAALARKLDEARRSGWNLPNLRDKIDEIWVNLLDFHPWRLKNAFGAPLSGSEKDIFVDTKLLLEAPATLHTRLGIAVQTPAGAGEVEMEARHGLQVCYTHLPFYAVSRSWDDGGNPTMTVVSSVEILVTSATSIWVTVELEDGRISEVTLREAGNVIFVNPQQGEVAELVMALAQCDVLSTLRYLRNKSLKHENISTQRCVKLFCGCNQYVNTNMGEILECSDSVKGGLNQELRQAVWHYSMPHDLSLWDKDHTLACFQFQARLVTLANEGCLILQPDCGWVQELEDKIKIAEDVSLVWVGSVIHPRGSWAR